MGANLRRALLRLTALLVIGAAATLALAGPHVEGRDAALSMLKARSYVELDAALSDKQRSYARGTLSELDLLDAFRVFYWSDPALEPFYDEWVGRFSNSYAARLARGIYLKRIGMAHGGDRPARYTAPDRIERMHAYYEKAMADFDASLKLEVKPTLSYLYMMDIKKYSRPVSIDIWLFRFDLIDAESHVLSQALKVAPESFILRRKYMHTLETRWGGSTAAMHAFLGASWVAQLTPEHFAALEALVLQDRGWVKAQRGDKAGSMAAYKEALARVDLNNLQLFEYGRRELLLHEAALAHQRVREYAQALRYLDMAIDAGASSPEIYIARGVSYHQLANMKAAVADYREAAERGNAWAQNEVGMYYWHGIVVERDRQEATKWFARSAEQGFPDGVKHLKWAKKLR
jgi:TPR repeat protein